MSNNGWLDLLEEKEEALRACTTQEGLPVPDGLVDEDAFHSRFRQLCVDSKVKTRGHQIRLFNDFRDSCGSIIKISEGNNGRPESLIYKTSLTALELGRKYGMNYGALIELQVALHRTVPKLANLSRWSNSSPVQNDLKTIYKTFIKFYMDLIKAYTTNALDPDRNLLSDETFKTIIETAQNSFSNARDAYNENVRRAEQSKTASSSGQNDAPFEPVTVLRLDFQILGIIGEGAHGRVFRIQEETTEEQYACKDIQMSTPSLGGKTKDDVKQEILVLKKLRHAHIVTIAFYSQADTGFRIFMDPLADHDLKYFLDDCAEKSFPDDTMKILPWFACLLHALEYAHSENIIHKDIKLANVLVKGSHVYLTDFSLARDFTDQDTSVAIDEKAVGTMRYRAPETRNNRGGGRKADVFSLGCVYAEMLTVVCGKPFKKLRERCEDDNYRDSLPAVDEWLHDLRKAKAEEKKVKAMDKKVKALNEKVNATCQSIVNMIKEDLDMRYSAQQALVSVEQISGLHCAHIH